MGRDADYIGLIEKARLGDKESLDHLIKLATARLRTDVYRLTFDYDLTQDVIQETLLEMYKILGNLKDNDRFWPWLYKVAINKIRGQYREKQRRKAVSISESSYVNMREDGQEAITKAASRELKDIVISAMRKLKPHQRAVLTMRCYREMHYCDIADSMGCSEFTARMRFVRAKKALARQLSSRGLGKGALLTVLVLFGKITAESEAAAATISVISATLKVGAAATLATMVASKTAVVTLTAAGVLAVGSSVALNQAQAPKDVISEKTQAKMERLLSSAQAIGAQGQECWYFFPEGAGKAVMIRMMEYDAQGRSLSCKWLQNEHANYYFNKRKNTVYLNNHRVWANDLSVWQVPTDSTEMSEFISQIQGESARDVGYVAGRGKGLLTITTQHPDESDSAAVFTYHRNVLDEDYFQYNWPSGTNLQDNRDEMHKRGWAYFVIEGTINERMASGMGRIPFVYQALKQHPAWLRLKIGDEKLVDAGGGMMFKGLARPWMGLHTIDTIRRDAAERYIGFETNYNQGDVKAQLVLTYENSTLTYTIDMEADIVEKIEFSGNVTGELRFSYLQDSDQASGEFSEPTTSRYGSLEKGSGILWLVQLAQ